MENEEIVSLLREIRDLQKQHVENYKDALKNQEASIALQASANRRQRISLIVLLVIVLVGVAILAFGSFTGHGFQLA